MTGQDARRVPIRRRVVVKWVASAELVFLVEEAPEGGYLARAVGEGIFTEADALDELRAMVCEAVVCH